MVVSREIELRISGYGEEEGTGVVRLAEFDGAARLARALKGLGLAWAASFATLFIPLAHLLLVPGFALFGLIVFFRRMGTHVLVQDIQGTCPDCKVEQQFEAGGRWVTPRALSCGNCRRGLRATVRT